MPNTANDLLYETFDLVERIRKHRSGENTPTQYSSVEVKDEKKKIRSRINGFHLMFSFYVKQQIKERLARYFCRPYLSKQCFRQSKIRRRRSKFKSYAIYSSVVADTN